MSSEKARKDDVSHASAFIALSLTVQLEKQLIKKKNYTLKQKEANRSTWSQLDLTFSMTKKLANLLHAFLIPHPAQVKLLSEQGLAD